MKTDLLSIKQRYSIVGTSDKLMRALDVALQVAPTDLSVLVSGESGAGKDVIGRIIHDHSPRRREKYFAINCGSIPEGTIDSELFGHVKGSFTGAISDSPGYFGAADKGTLFLDEVGELPLPTQARLLRVLETGEYLPVGATDVRRTDVRIVAATNVRLLRAISEGRFREDLYYRLNSVPIQMPPLRERGDDVVLLFRLFAMQMAEKYSMEKLTLTDEAKRLLTKYKWPGNVRQLKNVTEQMSILCPERLVTGEVMRRFIPDDEESTALVPASARAGGQLAPERELIFKMLFELQNAVTALRRDVDALKRGAAAADAPVARLPLSPATTAPQDDTADWAEAQEYEDTADSEASDLNLEQLSQQAIEKALARNNGNRKRTAEELGISDRTLYRRLKANKKQ